MSEPTSLCADTREAVRCLRIILSHRDHTPDAACLSEVMLHAEMALEALEGKQK